jgi:hypothetical protein
MHTYDPKILRTLASTYRARSITEPAKADLFLGIADDMEHHARRIEGGAVKPSKEPGP